MFLPSQKSKCQDLAKSENPGGGGGCVLAKSKLKLPRSA